MKLNKFWIFTIVLCFLLVSCGVGQDSTPTSIPTSEPSETHAIVLGDISDDPAEVIDGTQPLADYLASQLSDLGITEGQVKVASSTDEMAQLLANGEVDLYFDSTYPATLISDKAGAKIILRRWRFGVEQYQSVIFASVNSGITSIEQLPGHMVVMDTPYSTSGFVLPSVYLLEHGLTLTGKKSSSDPVESDEIGFVFSYDDE